MSTLPTVFLVDNGSLRPAATFGLRRLAAALSQKTGLRVEAVSLLHSHKIAPEDLDGVAATIVRRRLRELSEAGERSFVVLPLFLGPSLALSDYLPKLIIEAQSRGAVIEVVVADPLVGLDVEAPDPRLAEMLADQVRAVQLARGWRSATVALVDHGTPIRPVNQVRNAVARQLAKLLAADGSEVLACSMERREGAEYAFNDPLLESLAGETGFAGQKLIVAMFFLLPGRHAGAGGDVTEICQGMVDRGEFEQVCTTSLLGEHPRLLEVLEDRLRAVL